MLNLFSRRWRTSSWKIGDIVIPPPCAYLDEHDWVNSISRLPFWNDNQLTVFRQYNSYWNGRFDVLVTALCNKFDKLEANKEE